MKTIITLLIIIMLAPITSADLICGGRYMSDTKEVQCPMEVHVYTVKTKLYYERIEEFKLNEERGRYISALINNL